MYRESTCLLEGESSLQGEHKETGLGSERITPGRFWGSGQLEARSGFIRAWLLGCILWLSSRKKTPDLSSLSEVPVR